MPSIDVQRNAAAMQRYNDKVFMRDDKYLYFGNDGDESIRYDATNDSLAATSFNVIDGGLLSFGTGKDYSFNYDATSDALVLLTIPSDNPGIAGGLWWNAVSDHNRVLMVSSG